MPNFDTSERIKPLLIEEKRPPSEVRRHCRLLSRQLIEQIRPCVPDGSNVLFIFVLRGAMLLYPPFAEEFENASFCFLYPDTRTVLNCTGYDTAVIVDTVIETGKTVISAKNFLEHTDISAKNWAAAAVCANKTAQEKLSEHFDKVFCLEFMDNVRVTIDAGEYAVCGDNGIKDENNRKENFPNENT